MRRKKHRSVKNHGEYYPNMDLKVFRNLIKQLEDLIIASSRQESTIFIQTFKFHYNEKKET